MPGGICSRSSSRLSNWATSAGSAGRGPTMLIWPRSTLNSCGSSSSDVARMNRPMRVTRGSRSSLNSGPTRSLSALSVGQPRLGVGHHRAELQHVEQLAALADPLLAEQHRTTIGELDDDGDDGHDRQRRTTSVNSARPTSSQRFTQQLRAAGVGAARGSTATGRRPGWPAGGDGPCRAGRSTPGCGCRLLRARRSAGAARGRAAHRRR